MCIIHFIFNVRLYFFTVRLLFLFGNERHVCVKYRTNGCANTRDQCMYRQRIIICIYKCVLLSLIMSHVSLYRIANKIHMEHDTCLNLRTNEKVPLRCDLDCAITEYSELYFFLSLFNLPSVFLTILCRFCNGNFSHTTQQISNEKQQKLFLLVNCFMKPRLIHLLFCVIQQAN